MVLCIQESVEKKSYNAGRGRAKNQNLVSTFWHHLYGADQKASVDRKRKKKASEKTMDVGESSAQGGDLRLNESVTLREIANKAREKAMYERMERMKKQMETLTTILHKMRSERRGVHEERVRSSGMTRGHDNLMRSQSTRRFGGEGGNSSLRGGKS